MSWLPGISISIISSMSLADQLPYNYVCCFVLNASEIYIYIVIVLYYMCFQPLDQTFNIYFGEASMTLAEEFLVMAVP